MKERMITCPECRGTGDYQSNALWMDDTGPCCSLCWGKGEVTLKSENERNFPRNMPMTWAPGDKYP